MEVLDALTEQFDPLRPLDVDENDLYVDWQAAVGSDDVKARLVNVITRAGKLPVARLFTGHTGTGKTTELRRVKRLIEERSGGWFFVSLLEATNWLELSDLTSMDIVFAITRQLVHDLTAAGVSFRETRVGAVFQELWELLNREVEIKEIKAGPDKIAQIALALKSAPQARATFRKLLDRKLPTVLELINEVILKEAKDWLARSKPGFQDILVIVDELEKIPPKISQEEKTNNHEAIFLDNAGLLRFLKCDVLYTIPVALAYGSKRLNLENAYGAEIVTLPVLPVRRRDGREFEPGIGALTRIVERRVLKAGTTLQQFVEDPALIRQLCLLCGGHVRTLLMLLRSAISRCNNLPITAAIIKTTIVKQSSAAALQFKPAEWALLDRTHGTKRAHMEQPELWHDLLSRLAVFAYEDNEGFWYDWNPLLGHVPIDRRST
jgi:energy-coupling factor transporter ATP-binding protein EcfA2